MRKLFSHDDRFLFQQLRTELDAVCIPYLVKNEYAGGAMGELPWQETQLELWLMDEQWYEKAKAIVNDLVTKRSDKFAWQCGECGEVIEGHFPLCWNCQTSQEATDSGN
ncbi:DUF2007 domain-containing protein [Aestuariibacter sp. A3R04]|uniref:putative signal transducing protein n=1 Tax=Aestuariibacter sp. A3R04 TaxID=2841571 RepID=UPI001C09150D|nr:DUF2007 domain-containing protein [Aestuariibacter sp. A3R04]MBU3021501.1 DUF2007 domain-containing protein [Aestuariibacter sp. A3R04]